MSFTYKELHGAAIQHVPEGTIKSTSTWIGILLHTIKDISEIKPKTNAASNSDFLWIKCFKASHHLPAQFMEITLRTIKHEYFLRHPLESFELKFLRMFPAEEMQVKHLKAKSPIKDTNVVILRAVEQEDLQREVELDEAAGVVERVKQQMIQGRTGNDVENAIALDLSDDEVDEDLSNTQPGVKRKFADHDEDFADEEGMIDASGNPIYYGAIGNNAEFDNTAFEEAFAAGEQDVAPEEAQDLTKWTAFIDRWNALPGESRAAVNDSQWQFCETCNKQICVKPWTRFGQGHGALCTECSRRGLIDDGDEAGVAEMQDQCREEYAEKHLKQTRGLPQDMDDDAPVNCPEAVGGDVDVKFHAGDNDAEMSGVESAVAVAGSAIASLVEEDEEAGDSEIQESDMKHVGIPGSTYQEQKEWEDSRGRVQDSDKDDSAFAARNRSSTIHDAVDNGDRTNNPSYPVYSSPHATEPTTPAPPSSTSSTTSSHYTSADRLNNFERTPRRSKTDAPVSQSFTAFPPPQTSPSIVAQEPTTPPSLHSNSAGVGLTTLGFRNKPVRYTYRPGVVNLYGPRAPPSPVESEVEDNVFPTVAALPGTIVAGDDGESTEEDEEAPGVESDAEAFATADEGSDAEAEHMPGSFGEEFDEEVEHDEGSVAGSWRDRDTEDEEDGEPEEDVAQQVEESEEGEKQQRESDEPGADFGADAEDSEYTADSEVDE